ncbi:hypothetical protein [Flavobacterium sp.]|jgi:hypothetical protein|uniref:hypothetical protein n=1 Tax=Flavobacterium sp. TaxID=239 RepID=UPI0037C03C93
MSKAFLLVVALLTACTPVVYKKYGVTDAEANETRQQCNEAANDAAKDTYWLRKHYYSICMEEKGYTRTSQW